MNRLLKRAMFGFFSYVPFPAKFAIILMVIGIGVSLVGVAMLAWHMPHRWFVIAGVLIGIGLRLAADGWNAYWYVVTARFESRWTT